MDYTELNAQIKLKDAEGNLQIFADRMAIDDYQERIITPNTKHFDSIEEKIDWMIANDYWDKNTLDDYSREFVVSLFQRALDAEYEYRTFMGILKFYSSYSLRTDDGTLFLETLPERAVMVALHLSDGDETLATRLTDDMVAHRYQPATPTFQNAGKARAGELTSCFLIDISDSLDALTDSWNYCAQLSKIGGGVAFNLSNIREEGAPLKGKHGLAKGVFPWAKIADDIFTTVDQLGTRQGAGAAYINVHHPDLMTLLDAKGENADEKSRLKTLSLGLVVTDVAFKAAKEGKSFYQFSAYDVERVYGMPFSQVDITANYETLVNDERIKKTEIDARSMFRKIAQISFESGYPYLVFIDTVNRENPDKGSGRVIMSNLCLTGDGLLLTDQGLRRLDDLYKSGQNIRVMSDMRAVSGDVTDSSLVAKESTPVHLTQRNADIYRIHLASGHQIKATAEHSFFVRTRDKQHIIEKQVKDLERFDTLLIQSHEGAFGVDDSPKAPHIAYLAGVVAGAQNRTPLSRFRIFGAHRKEIAACFEEHLHAVLVDREDLKTSSRVTLAPRFDSFPRYERIHSVAFSTILGEFGITENTLQEVPQFVYEGSRETQVAYLSGLYANLKTSMPRLGNLGNITTGGIPRPLLLNVLPLLNNLGIFGSLKQERRAFGHSRTAPARHSVLVVEGVHARKLYETLSWVPTHQDMYERVRTALESDNRNSKNLFTSPISSVVKEKKTEDVYDVSVPDGHSIIVNGIVTHNCSEILQPHVPSVYNDDTGEVETVGRDVSCVLGSLVAWNWLHSPDPAQTVDTAVRSLAAVVEKTDIRRVPPIQKANMESRSHGLGMMDLAHVFARHGFIYGDEYSVELTDAIFGSLNYYSLKANMELARERGSYKNFATSDYASGAYFERYRDWSDTKWGTPVLEALATYTLKVPTQEDWKQLEADVKEHGVYASHRIAIAPTASISYIVGATSSVAPIDEAVITRKEKVGRVHCPAPGLEEENGLEILKSYVTAAQVGPEGQVKVFAALTPHVDQGASCTVTLPVGSPLKRLTRHFMNAWESGLKTLYYTRIEVDSELADKGLAQECVSCSI